MSRAAMGVMVIATSLSAELVVRGTVEPARPLIGDVVRCVYTVHHEGRGTLEPVALTYSSAAFLAVSSETWRHRSWFGGRTIDGVRFTLQAVQVGTHTIAAAEIRLRSPEGVTTRVPPAMTVVVSHGVFPPNMPRDGDLADIAGPRGIIVWWPVALVAGTAVLLLVGALRSFRRVRPVGTPVVVAARDPLLDALQRLDQLAEGHLAAGRVKEFYLELSAILRGYVEACTGVNALELTTDELSRALRGRVSPDYLGRLRGVLADFDLPKYAKHEPSVEEMRADLMRGRDMLTGLRTASSQRTPPSGEAGTAT